MSLHSFTHVALRVHPLREAEVYYCKLFGLSVAWREAETPEGWSTLPAENDWDDAERALIFDDKFGVRWEINTFDYADPPGMSTGTRLGRWLNI